MALVTPTPTTLYHPCLYYALQFVASLRKPQQYLEVGVCDGDSVKVVVEATLDSLQKLVLCDTWGGEFSGTGRGTHEYVARLLADTGYKGEIQWLDGDSHQLLRPAVQGQSFDLILIDGDHSEAGARQDLMDCYETLTPGGFLLFDDIFHYEWLLGIIRGFVTEHPEFRMVGEFQDASTSGVAVVERVKL